MKMEIKMGTHIKTQKVTNPNRSTEKSEDHREVYSNSVSLAATIWDISLVFGRSEIKSANSMTTTFHTTVIMSPQHAKALSRALSKAVEDYEKQHGELNIEGNN